MVSMRDVEHVISEPLRAQLVSLGIPPAKHTPDALSGFFPREYNVGAAGLGAEDLAKVLVYLATHGVVPVSGAGAGASLKKVQPGWHFCQIYRDFDQLIDLVAPYIAEGLRNGEGCLWVLPTAVRNAAVREALGRRLGDVDPYLASGQLEFLSHPDWYLDASGRLKSFEEVSAALIRKQDEVMAKGFTFLRAAGDAGWVSGTEQSRSFIDYERKVNAVIGATKTAAVCTFRAGVTADELVDIVTAHQDALHKATSH
jgi:hypothetical protein